MGSRKTLVILSALALVFVVVFTAAFALQRAETLIATQARKQLATLKPALDVHFRRVKINPLTRMLMLEGVEVRSSSFDDVLHVKTIGAGKVDWDSIVTMIKTRKPVMPRQLSFAARGLSVPARWTGTTAAETLRGLGYETLEVSASVAVELDPATRSFAISPFTVEVKNAGRLDFSIELVNASLPSKSDIDLLRRDPKAFVTERLPAYGNVALRSIALSYEDDSLTTKLVDFFVAQGEDHPVSLVDLALETQTAGRRTANASPTFARRGLEALRAFLEKPGTIGIQSTLREPVPFTSLLDDSTGGSIEEIASKLALEVERY